MMMKIFNYPANVLLINTSWTHTAFIFKFFFGNYATNNKTSRYFLLAFFLKKEIPFSIHWLV